MMLGMVLKTAKNPTTIATIFIAISVISSSPSSTTLSSRLLSPSRQGKEPKPCNVKLADGTILPVARISSCKFAFHDPKILNPNPQPYKNMLKKPLQESYTLNPKA